MILSQYNVWVSVTAYSHAIIISMCSSKRYSDASSLAPLISRLLSVSFHVSYLFFSLLLIKIIIGIASAFVNKKILLQHQKCPKIAPHPLTCAMTEQNIRITAGANIGYFNLLFWHSCLTKYTFICIP